MSTKNTTTTTTASVSPPPPPAAAASAAANAEDVDDLDDLDDVLDEFNAASSSSTKPATSAPPAPASTSQPPTERAPVAAEKVGQVGDDDADLDDVLSQDFAKELAQGMQALMKELGGSADSNSEGFMGGAVAGADGGAGEAGAGAGASAGAGAGEQFNEQELMKQFEAMMAGLGGPTPSSSSSAVGAGGAATHSSSTAKADGKPANFNDALNATMAKLKQSDASATAETSSSLSSDNPFAGLSGAEGEEMAKLLAALSGGGGGDLSGLEGAMDNPELTKMLEGMMDELMSREILYEPLKELRDKYPAYLSGSESKDITNEDRKRYEQQSKYIDEIVRIFEEPGYDAKDKRKAARVQELMNQMQDCGSPPKQIVGDMPAELENLPGFGGGEGANEECTIM
ncbi:related to PEX19 - required for biogenesis of peroxisomes (peroxin) [Melanopsichium pennsylvanicum]|uniref:Related to PEX19 - required for biogenesis of peroxisomes (Peroxin) n=2 Tax=Melanopsichium pennsylvanicum TaxID=63383 RepID=A0AAJ4XTG6_9BASI|nr:related to PEX19-required for biogenesis of peroxisomes (peroxin) [Melanopsichium pennsylvanicum 4]SNX86843.1 related to PEX19 - required for biogenesis of peroxisomes (peroxin) [Melanopsichium pennsylvanicum]